MKTLQELTKFNEGIVVHVVHLMESDYPYCFIGEEYVGWMEYIDHSNFDPFEILGFTVMNHRIDYDDDIESDKDVPEAWELESEVLKDGVTFTEACKAFKAMHPAITIESWDSGS
jgi:hypothetical protein